MAVGEVEILLNGKPETLRSSLDAAKRVNALGGFMSVHAKLQAYDFDFFVMVIAAGLGKKASDVEAPVYKTGLPKLLGDVSTFVNYLANGGKPFTQSGEAEPGEE
jgi:hypothetical protein